MRVVPDHPPFSRSFIPVFEESRNRLAPTDAPSLNFPKFVDVEMNIEGEPPQTFIATTVLRRQPDGSWKALIDNARGPQILDSA
jgi:hypothetical protein